MATPGPAPSGMAPTGRFFGALASMKQVDRTSACLSSTGPVVRRRSWAGEIRVGHEPILAFST